MYSTGRFYSTQGFSRSRTGVLMIFEFPILERPLHLVKISKDFGQEPEETD